MTKEEALEIIKTNCSYSDNKLMEACSMFIPELKESEDERIRKEIIDWMKGGNTYEWQDNKDRWIAYLERQKEQKHSIGGLSWKNHDGYFDDDSGIPTLLKYKALIRRNGKYSLGFSIISGDEYILLKDIEAAITQNTAEWSEEDKKIMNTIIKEGDLKPSEICWLESLPDRFGFQEKSSLEKALEAYRISDERAAVSVNKYSAPTSTVYESMDELIADALVEMVNNSNLPEFDKYNRLAWIKKQKMVHKYAKFFKPDYVHRVIDLLDGMAEENENNSCPYNASDLRQTAAFLKFLNSKEKNGWTAEDKKMLEDIADHLREYYVNKKGYPYVMEKDSVEMKEMSFLWTLPEKIAIQPEAEWTEEDKNNLAEVISILNESGQYFNENYSALIEWLKSFIARKGCIHSVLE